MQIKQLFDSSKDIYRTIEKVITYNANQEARLKTEISEYIVTENIEEQFEELLSKMQLAMDMGGENEIGVWVSGFYGSGKSSFTKYLGLALDGSTQIEGTPFLKHLQDRMSKAQTKALLSTIAKRFPAAVVLLDLASEMLAGATMEDVATVLYYKVLQWAGYSQNLKVAALERRLKKDGRYEEFTQRIQQDIGVAWEEVQNDPLVIDSLIPELAHDLYPKLFKSATAFNTEASDFVRFENDRVKEMLNIVREATGKEYVLFIVDEVGQYVASRPNLILNLDGLAKNLKSLGNGKVWIMGTAQQTLTEDDPRAALNSPELYKLKDRFPIEIDLESSDIKEICIKRLLGKSPAGEKEMGKLFDKYGQTLRHNTKLEDAKYYDADFDKATFVNLYPFLPSHFDILLHLLGALAKSTGGIGLRSAIKVIQDILIEGPEGQQPVANHDTGWLATTVTLYDALEKDIQRASPSVHKAVGKTIIRFPDSSIHQDVAKTVAVLQILGNMPVTQINVISLIHPTIESTSRADEIKQAIEDLKKDGMVPFGEKDGNLVFFSEKINEIDKERAELPLRSIETRRIQNESLREVFSPLPSTRLNNTLSVTSGLKTNVNNMLVSLAGDRETIQTIVEFVIPEDYQTARTRLVNESRQHSAKHSIFLLGRVNNDATNLVSEIYRSREIANRHRNDPDQEVKEYCRTQTDRANTLITELENLYKNQLRQGSFIFRGQTTAVDSLSQDLLDAAKKHLIDMATQVFDRYNEAPVRAETNLAEKFLRLGNLNAITAAIDPMELVKIVGGTPRIESQHKALISIKDYLDQGGSVDGKRLTNHFTSAPFGWSADTLRYLVAVLLVNGELKLKISGREITVNGQQAIEGLRTNNAFKSVGIALRDGQLAPDVLARAAERLTKLTGERVIPLEQEISKAAMKYFPQLQQRYGSLEEKLRNLRLPGVENIRALNQDLAEVLDTDASDLPQRVGSEQAVFFASLNWAGEASKALQQGLEVTLNDLKEHVKEISELPNSGIPGNLKREMEELLQQIAARIGEENFFKHSADLNTALTAIKTAVQKTAQELSTKQAVMIKAAQTGLQEILVWQELTQEEQSQTLAQLDVLELKTSKDLSGLKQLLAREYSIQTQTADSKQHVLELARERQMERLREEQELAIKDGDGKLTRHVKIPRTVTDLSRLDAVIKELQKLRSELTLYSEIEINIEIEE